MHHRQWSRTPTAYRNNPPLYPRITPARLTVPTESPGKLHHHRPSSPTCTCHPLQTCRQSHYAPEAMRSPSGCHKPQRNHRQVPVTSTIPAHHQQSASPSSRCFSQINVISGNPHCERHVAAPHPRVPHEWSGGHLSTCSYRCLRRRRSSATPWIPAQSHARTSIQSSDCQPHIPYSSSYYTPITRTPASDTRNRPCSSRILRNESRQRILPRPHCDVDVLIGHSHTHPVLIVNNSIIGNQLLFVTRKLSGLRFQRSDLNVCSCTTICIIGSLTQPPINCVRLPLNLHGSPHR